MTKTKWIIVAVIAVVALYSWSVYNSLINTNETADKQWAQVETQYQRRFDLIPNLVSTVKGITAQEQTVFGDISSARANYTGATTVAGKVDAANQVESSLSRLLAIVENYPQLHSSESFQTLMAQLEGTENRINVERQRFNDDVRSYNLVVKRFPSNVFAKLYGYAERPYFEIASGVEQNPQVNF